MSHHVHEQKVPRPALYAALALMLFTIAVAGYSRRAHAAPETAASSVFVDIRFEDRPDGTVIVLDADDGRGIAEVPPGTNGFVRGVMRGMFRTRKLEAIDRGGRFRLSRETTGRLTLLDLEDGRRVDLDSFGPTNARSFAGILEAGAASVSTMTIGCTVRMSHTRRDLSMELELDDGVVLRPGDRVVLVGDPMRPAFGEEIVERRTAIVERASWPARMWTRLAGHFSFLSLLED